VKPSKSSVSRALGKLLAVLSGGIAGSALIFKEVWLILAGGIVVVMLTVLWMTYRILTSPNSRAYDRAMRLLALLFNPTLLGVLGAEGDPPRIGTSAPSRVDARSQHVSTARRANGARDGSQNVDGQPPQR
jgi:hypothetical protein